MAIGTVTSTFSSSQNLNQAKPTTKPGQITVPTFIVENGTSDIITLIRCAVKGKLPDGAVMTKAELYLTNQTSWPASTNLTVSKVTQTWNPKTTYWNQANALSTTSPIIVNVSSTAAKFQHVIDVTSHITLNNLNGTTPHYGWKLSVNNLRAGKFYGSTGSLHAYLKISYAFTSIRFSDLHPGSAATDSAHFEYVPIAEPSLYALDSLSSTFDGGTEMDALQIQQSVLNSASPAINASGGFVTPGYTSPIVTTETPEYSLSDDVGAVVQLNNDNDYFWWIMRARNDGGTWGPWSSKVRVYKKAYGTLTLVDPGPALPFVGTANPRIDWTFTGQTQTGYQVIVYDPDDGDAILYDSKRLVDTDTYHDLPYNVIDELDKDYKVEVRVWDTFENNRVPAHDNVGSYGDYVVSSTTFQYALSSAVAPVTDFVAVMGDAGERKPYATLSWTRTGTPNSFDIIRDGKVLEWELSLEDANQNGDDYFYVDRTAPGTSVVSYEVRVREGTPPAEDTSLDNPVEFVQMANSVAWIIDPIEEIYIPISGEAPVELELSDVGTNFTPLNASYDIRVHNALKGYSGKVSGGLCGECLGDGSTSEDLQNTLLSFRKQPTKVFRLSIGNVTIPVIIFNVTTAPRYGPAFNKLYDVKFEFFQVQGY